jgi:ferredoxin
MAAEILTTPYCILLTPVLHKSRKSGGKVAFNGLRWETEKRVPQKQRKEKCPDCEQCQLCSESRCRLCRGEHCKRASGELGSSFTYGEYLAWKNEKALENDKRQATSQSESIKPGKTLKKNPVIDRAECTDCESCLSLRPDIFKRNPETGGIEVAELPEYPQEDIERVMSMCPGECITWE